MTRDNLIPTLGQGLIHLDLNRVLVITPKGHAQPVERADDLLAATDNYLIHIIVRPHTVDGEDPAVRGAIRHHHYRERDGWTPYQVYREHVGDPTEIRAAAEKEREGHQICVIPAAALRGGGKRVKGTLELLPFPAACHIYAHNRHLLAAYAIDGDRLLLLQGGNQISTPTVTSNPEMTLRMYSGPPLDVTVRVCRPDGNTQYLAVRHDPTFGRVDFPTHHTVARLQTEPRSRQLARRLRLGRVMERRWSEARLAVLRSGAHRAVGTTGHSGTNLTDGSELLLMRNRTLTFAPTTEVRQGGVPPERLFEKQLARIVEAHLSELELRLRDGAEAETHRTQQRRILDIAATYRDAFRDGRGEPDGTPLFRYPEPLLLDGSHIS
jgi:hypothetical protein